jgi:L-rhamnose mutarotase
MSQTENSNAIYGDTNPTPEQVEESGVKRMLTVFALNPERERLYRELHANAWPAIIDRLKKSNMRNYSIFINELAGQKYVASYFEYTGSDWEADQQAIAEHPETQRWWQALSPCGMDGIQCGDADPVFYMA